MHRRATVALLALLAASGCGRLGFEFDDLGENSQGGGAAGSGTGGDGGLIGSDSTALFSADDCGLALDTHTSGSSAEPDLIVVGIYEPPEPPGAFSLQITRARRIVLLLSSYEAVAWKVTVGASTTLERVIIAGYDNQTANLPGGVPVEFHSYQNGGDPDYWGVGYQWPSEVAARGEAVTGLSTSAFAGCYHMGQLAVGG